MADQGGVVSYRPATIIVECSCCKTWEDFLANHPDPREFPQTNQPRLIHEDELRAALAPALSQLIQTLVLAGRSEHQALDDIRRLLSSMEREVPAHLENSNATPDNA